MRAVKSGGASRIALAWILAAAATPAMAQTEAVPPAPEQSAASLAAPAASHSGPAPTIQSIAVKGNERIEPETIASYLVVAPGDRAEPELLDLGLKTLFNTGLFADVTLAMQPGNVLLIEVKENPIVNRLILEGNRRLKDDKLTEDLQVSERAIFTRAKVQADVQRIIDLYRQKGRFAASVTPKVTPLDQNRVDVIYEIDEGPKTGVAKINFVGNDAFTSGQLRDVVLTNESRWWKMFASHKNFDPDRVEYDRELLRQFYAKNGYADFTVVSSVAELTPDRKDFFITFTVDEGPRYKVGEVKVKTSLAKLDENALENFVPIKTGEMFNGEKVEKTVESITFATGSTGYAFVDVNPRLDRNPETRTIDITFEVNEGPRVYVERVNIKGNTRTLDKVIRREVRIAEGDPFNRVLVDRSKARIKSLDFFKEVEIEETAGSAPDRTELDVTVEEKSTGSFSVGIGVSSTENFIVDLSVSEKNLMGKGQLLVFRVQASSRTRQVDIRFTQPYFLDRNLAAGFSLFNQRTNYRESGFIRDRVGFGLNAGFQISEYGRGSLQYLLTHDNVEIDAPQIIGIAPGTDLSTIFLPGVTPRTYDGDGDGVQDLDIFTSDPLFIADTCEFVDSQLTPSCESEGKFLTSLIGYSLSFDKRDDPLRPTRGWRLGLTQAMAGLGGDVNYWRTEANGAMYHPIIGKFIGALKFRMGYVDGFAGDNVRLSDRFFEGADTFRGFEVAGIGPRYLPRNAGLTSSGDIVGQSIGGKVYAIGTAEIHIPLPLPKEYGIQAALFSDFGTVGLVDEATKTLNDNLAFWVDPDGDGLFSKPIQDDLALRVSAGVSVSWESPFGPVRFDLSRVLRKEEYDRTEGFRFSAGTTFN